VSIFILQIAGGILAIVYQSHLGDILKETMKNAMELYPTSNEEGPGAKRAWDLVQKKVSALFLKEEIYLMILNSV
jgi:hypothetical protein